MSDKPRQHHSKTDDPKRGDLDEARLKSAVEIYYALFNTTSDGVWIHGLDGVIREVNDAYCRMSGYSREELTGMPVSTLEAVESPEEVAAHIRKVVEKGGHDRFDSQHRRKDGRVIDVDITALYLEHEGGRMAIFARDITERKQVEREIRNLARLPEENPSPVLRISREGVILYANPAAMPLLWEGDNEGGGNVPDVLRAFIEEVFAEQSSKTFEVERDGRIWSFVVTPIRDSGYANFRGRDVTDQRRAEEALHVAVERLERAQTGAGVGIWDWDIATGHIEWSSYMFELFGLDESKAVASFEAWENILHPEDREAVGLRIDQALKDRTLLQSEYRIIRPDGQMRWINAVGRSTYDAEGNPLRMAGICTDITGRRQTEEAVRESEEKYRLLADSIADGFYALDSGWRFVYVNDATVEYLGKSRDELLGRHLLEIFPDVRGTIFETEYRRVIEAGEIAHFEAPSVVTGRVVEVNAYPGPGHMIVLFRDVTERNQAEQELRLQSTALNAAANGIVITDREGHIQWVNDAFTRLTGYSAAEAIDNNPRVLKSGHHDQQFYKNLWDTVLSGRVWHGEIVNKRKDGRLYTEEMTITPVLDAAGSVTNFIAIKTDITARKMAEEAVAEANARVQRLLSANVIGIAEFDATKIVNANRALLDMTGYSERDVLRGKIDWREITPPEYAERDNRAWREMMEHGECLPYEKEYITRDGKRIPILIAGVRLTEDPVTGVFLNLDITDWKLMERELRETTHFAEHLFESSLIGLTRFDANGLVDANDAFLDMVGYSREDLYGGIINIRAITPPEYAALDQRAMGEMLATEESTAHEKEYFRKDGSRVPVLIGRKLIKESPLEWVAFVLDLTERKRAEADLERVRTEFLGEVSHELKTPITAIKGCASMALSAGTPPDPSETRELFEVVDTQANRLTDLVSNLLDMTRIEAGRLPIEPTETEVGKILEEAKTIFEHSRYAHSLQIELPARLPRVKADGRRIVQVLSNLCSNAAKFSSPNTPIVMSAEHSDGEVVVSVCDSGVGVPADKMPLLFQKFTQIHTVGAKGTGLGLFICKGIIEAQGGRIWAESAGEGQGTTFSFALPAIAHRPGARRKASAVPSSRAGKRRPVDMSGGRRRVVAIDDEPHILRYLEHCLKTANYDVASTTDPRAATRLVESHKPDIVLLDMRLPGTSGLEVLEKIRTFSDVPVAFITATANREDVERGRHFGGTTWLEKPFSREALLEHVRGIASYRRRRKEKA
jgi:PAS domain S-box-containing protein